MKDKTLILHGFIFILDKLDLFNDDVYFDTHRQIGMLNINNSSMFYFTIYCHSQQHDMYIKKFHNLYAGGEIVYSTTFYNKY